MRIAQSPQSSPLAADAIYRSFTALPSKLQYDYERKRVARQASLLAQEQSIARRLPPSTKKPPSTRFPIPLLTKIDEVESLVDDENDEYTSLLTSLQSVEVSNISPVQAMLISLV